ncbi:hypothetical protein EC968_006743 [Mortierella alpina]|nr:hypothetical protein EC968_006743 [Mortierella alpina]
MPVQDTSVTSRELLDEAHSINPNSDASSVHDTMVATDSSHADNYWLGEYLDSQAFPQMQYEHLMFQGMNTDSQDLQSSARMTTVTANDVNAAVDPNVPAGILLQAKSQPKLSDCFAEDMDMTTPSLPMSTAPNSMRVSPSPTTASTVASRDQAVLVKIEDDESPRLRVSSVQAVDGSTAASNCRTPSPFVEDALRSANAIIHRGGTAQSVSYVQQHAPEVVVQQMQLQIQQEHQQLQMQMQAFAQMYGQQSVSVHHGESATAGSSQETAAHIQLLEPFRSTPTHTLSQVSPHVQLTAPVDGRVKMMSTNSESLLQLPQLQGQTYDANLLVGISGITDKETLQALTDAAASSSLSQDLVFGPNLRSLLIEGSNQPDYSNHELYEVTFPQPVVTPTPSTLVVRNVHRSRRASPYPSSSSKSTRNHSSGHDDGDDEEGEQDDNSDRCSAESPSSSSSAFPSSSKTSNKHSYLNNNYPHKCKHPGCNRTFASVGLLKSHIVSHNEDKKYWCNLCSYDGVTPRPPAPPAWPGAPVHIPEVKRYKRNHDLLRHKREQHPPIEVKIQREVERQMAKEARKQKNAAERRERTVGAGRNGRARRGEMAAASTPTELDTAAYMAIARGTAMRAYYMNAGLDAGVCNNNNNNNNNNDLSSSNNCNSTPPIPNSFGEQTPQIIHPVHSIHMMQQLHALQLQQQHQSLQPQYWMHTVPNPATQAMNNALLLQQQHQQQYQQHQQQYQQQYQQSQPHSRAMTVIDAMNTNIPYSTGVPTTANFGSGLLLPTPAPTVHHSRSGSTFGDMAGSLGPSAQSPHNDADGDENMTIRGIEPTRRALARSTVGRVRGRALTAVDKGQNFHPYAGQYRRTRHRK